MENDKLTEALRRLEEAQADKAAAFNAYLRAVDSKKDQVVLDALSSVYYELCQKANQAAADVERYS